MIYFRQGLTLEEINKMAAPGNRRRHSSQVLYKLIDRILKINKMAVPGNSFRILNIKIYHFDYSVFMNIVYG